MDYETWIQAYRLRKPDLLGLCKEACEEMQITFPELTMVRGHLFLSNSTKTPTHWWLKDPKGVIVDPTASQYIWEAPWGKKAFILHYDEWTEGHKEPTGKCPQCGGYAFDSNKFCKDSCETKYMAYLNDHRNHDY